ncbi:hypothetical protein AVEN_232921-1 [Araneus ventricosus]|uniref:CCHC-type domain-containing protein n=1 Tax=Araneus ventricosus TaxID=182803 RepID=A0A4Y1ZL30_ARAVE|nr:hypothetical protein AVEN_232921-1 [Araneus ventricosus]
MRLSVRAYIPNPLRCFQCQRFGHSKTSYCGTLTCPRCAEVGHDNSQCAAAEKCVNCKDAHTSFSRNCSEWKLEKEIITTKIKKYSLAQHGQIYGSCATNSNSKIKKQISSPEARKLVKSMTPTPGNSYVSVAKKSASAPSADRNKDASVVSISKLSESLTRASPPMTNLPIPSTPPVAPVSEEDLASPDLTDFTLVINKKCLKKLSY